MQIDDLTRITSPTVYRDEAGFVRWRWVRQHIMKLWLMFSALLLVVQTMSVAQDNRLEAGVPVAGTISVPNNVQSWTFFGVEGQVVSLLVNGTAGDFDPVISLRDDEGSELIRNDDFAYPGRNDAMLQAITLPVTTTYTVNVSGYGGTTGSYALTLFDGYSEMAEVVDFSDTSNPWSGSRNALDVEQVAGRIALSIDGIQQSGYALPDVGGDFRDFFTRIEIVNADGRNGWIVGLTLRHQSNRYYLLSINNLGQWRLTYRSAGEMRLVRDWTLHPAIRPDDGEFTISVLVNGAAFDVFYDDFYVGQAVDEAYNPGETGLIGLYAETPNAANSATLVEYDNLTVTTPVQVGAADVLPEHLMPGPLALTIQELERRRLIPAGGQQVLSVPESSGIQLNPGVNRIILARGTTFSTMVMGTNMRIEAAAPGVVGCGLLFDNSSETDHAVAFLDQTGGYGLSLRDASGFQPGIFGEDPDLLRDSSELIVVRLPDAVHYYINRVLVGSMPIPAGEGEVGNIAINYETVQNTCRFTDTWLWNLP